MARSSDRERDRAARRLDDARNEEDRLRDRYEAKQGTAGEEGAQDDLEEASEQLAAKEAALKWLDRDY